MKSRIVVGIHIFWKFRSNQSSVARSEATQFMLIKIEGCRSKWLLDFWILLEIHCWFKGETVFNCVFQFIIDSLQTPKGYFDQDILYLDVSFRDYEWQQ